MCYEQSVTPLTVNQIVVLLRILSDTTNRKKVTKAGNLLARNKFQKHGRNSAMTSIKG